MEKEFYRDISFIKNYLREDEEILFYLKSQLAMHSFERIYLGFIDIFLHKKCILFFTNKRILCAHTNFKYLYKKVIEEILYENIKSIEIKNRKIIIEYFNLKKDVFLIPKKHLNKIPENLIEYVNSTKKKLGNLNKYYICPKCGSELKLKIFKCEKCNMEFIDKEKMKKYAIFLPGIYYYNMGGTLNKFKFIIVTLIQIFAILITSYNLYLTISMGKSLQDIATAFIYLIVILLSIALSGYFNVKLSDEFIAKKTKYFNNIDRI